MTINQFVQNLVWASPTGATGAPAMRSLVAADIPTTLGATTFPGININNNFSIELPNSSGTFTPGTYGADLFYASSNILVFDVWDSGGSYLFRGPSYATLATLDLSGNFTAKGLHSNSLTVTGPVVVTTSPNTNWMMDGSGNSLTIANGASSGFPAGAGLIACTNQTSGDSALFLCAEGNALLLGSTGGTWSSGTSPATGHQSLGWTGGSNYALYNNTGATVTYAVSLICRVRSTP